MKALKFYAARDIRYEDAEEPVLQGAYEVKIKVKAVGICGSDISRYAKLGPYVAGMVWGHEFSGEVVEVGTKVTKVKVHDKVTACPALYCGICDSCKKGTFAQCEQLDVIGAHRYGAFAESVVIPEENVVPVPKGIDYFEKIVRNELQVFGSWNAISAPFPGKEWETSVHFIANGKLKIAPLITHRMMLKDGPKAFEMTANRSEYFGKIILHPGE